jgi:hypothetical protein
MKKPYHFLVLYFLSFSSAFPLLGQTASLDRQVVASAGGEAFAAGKSFECTLGESIIATVDNGSIVLTQGFQQPEKITIGVSEIAEASGLRIFPNPTSAELHLQFSAPSGTVFQLQVINAAGQLVQTLPKTDDSTDSQVDCRSFAPGTYFLLAHTTDGRPFFQVPFVKLDR